MCVCMCVIAYTCVCKSVDTEGKRNNVLRTDSVFGSGDKYFDCFQLTFEGIHNGVEDCLTDLLKTLLLQLHAFSNVEEACKTITWYYSWRFVFYLDFWTNGHFWLLCYSKLMVISRTILLQSLSWRALLYCCSFATFCSGCLMLLLYYFLVFD